MNVCQAKSHEMCSVGLSISAKNEPLLASAGEAERPVGTVLAGGPALTYRPDIDGLRAVAVLSVLGFHLDIKALSGGFVGVDVFFVISGFLISSIIVSEIAASQFSIISFYERRIRRIFPAFFAMLIAVSAFSIVYLLPAELAQGAQSMIAALTSLANFYFWQHSGYFEAPTSQPLLHTWSLSVEEQFYLFFPVFLVFVHRYFPQRLKAAVVSLFMASLLASVIIVEKDPTTAFYMPYTRGWELLLGTILSLRILPRLRAAWQRNLATLTGAGLIAYAVGTYSSTMQFPGLSALLPCLGAALIILGGQGGSSLVGAVLSWRPMVFVGLISYSLYLWHWPVIYLQKLGVLVSASDIAPERIAQLFTVRQAEMIVGLIVSFLLAVISWQWIEQPFRRDRLRLKRSVLFGLTGAVLLALLGLSYWTVLAEGFPNRFPVDAVRIAQYVNRDVVEDEEARTGRCFITTENRFEDYRPDLCLRADSRKNNDLLLGDSHGAMLWAALAAALPDTNIMQANSSGCAPLLASAKSANCRAMMDYIFQTYLRDHPVQNLILAARWSESDLTELTATLAWAKEHAIPVTVVGPMPEYDAPLPRLLAYAIAWNKPDLAKRHLVARQKSLDQKMQALAAGTWAVPYISIYQALCRDDVCIEYADPERTIPLMSDKDHLNRFGAALLVHRLLKAGQLRPARPRQ
jgi:peptidoglycan/LPS O-acetylase OafA/YrhL